MDSQIVAENKKNLKIELAKIIKFDLVTYGYTLINHMVA